MRVLFLCPRWPYPVRKGDQVVAYHRLRTLSRQHELTLVSFADRPLSPAELAPVAKYCKKIYVIQTSRVERALAAVQGAFNREVPLQVSYFESRQLTGLLQHLLASGDFDVVHSLLLRLAPQLVPFAGRVVLELVDSMELNFRRQLSETRSPWRRLLVREEHRRLAGYEAAMAERFPQRTVVSELDRVHTGVDTQVLPNGVVIPHALPGGAARAPARLVFHGNLAYHANQAAVSWLTSEVWPLLKARLPEVELYLVGASPPPWMLKLAAEPGITVTGEVPSIAEILRGATVALAPMRSGSGIQNKVLEAMAQGLPVVATTYAIGGLGPESLAAMVTADDAEGFAEATLNLLANPLRRAAMGQAGHDYVARHHSWERAATRIEQLYWRATHNPAPWLNA